MSLLQYIARKVLTEKDFKRFKKLTKVFTFKILMKRNTQPDTLKTA